MVDTTTARVVARPTPSAPPLAWNPKKHPTEVTVRPNVAALMTWHYKERRPYGLGHLWNFLDPGIGIHVASLDQGADTVEFGFGGQVALWGGLAVFGYGYNVSVSSNNEYYFVGIGLTEMLSKMQSSFAASDE